jgi:hypothetical protein
MYDPSVGRWLEEDPEGFNAGDSNLERYGGNDPVDRVDPSGLSGVGVEFYWRAKLALRIAQQGDQSLLGTARVAMEVGLERGQAAQQAYDDELIIAAAARNWVERYWMRLALVPRDQAVLEVLAGVSSGRWVGDPVGRREMALAEGRKLAEERARRALADLVAPVYGWVFMPRFGGGKPDKPDQPSGDPWAFLKTAGATLVGLAGAAAAASGSGGTINPADFVGHQAVVYPHSPAGTYTALVVDGKVYVARFHIVAWELAGKKGTIQFYGSAEIDAAGKVVRLFTL